MEDDRETIVRMIGATEFKAHMASYIEAMNETGERIVLLRHNQPWAMLSPPGEESKFAISESYEEQREHHHERLQVRYGLRDRARHR